MAANGKLSAKDYKTDQEVRWCPGCGDYAILAALQSFMPELDVPKENIVFVSGIGCAARFPYYMETYGMHSIHGRAGDRDRAGHVAPGSERLGRDRRRGFAVDRRQSPDPRAAP
jgi:pyruvate/2-oxoacid:ferredoxin oxidoreductase beta subunit